MCIILVSYNKMINTYNIDKDIIQNSFIKKELDILIHDTYNKHEKTGYHHIFCDVNIKIGKICLI
jgi:hypothetical protein